jgi:hypothetical protein
MTIRHLKTRAIAPCFPDARTFHNIYKLQKVTESRSGRGVQHYVIQFVSDLLLIGGFLGVLRFPPPIKLTATI